MRFNVAKSALLGWAAAAVASSWMTAPTLAMMANPNPIQLKQADGSTFTARMHGNEVYHDVTDIDGYTIMLNELDEYVYAELCSDGTTLVPSKHKVGGSFNPKEAGWPLHLTEPTKETNIHHISGRHLIEDHPDYRELREHRQRRLASTTGTLKNLVILLRFQDHANRSLPTRQEYVDLMNAEKGEKPASAPTGSMKHFYHQFSYDLLTVESTVTEWITIPKTEKTCADNSSGGTSVIHDCITDALNILNGQNLDFKQFDADGDGWIDGFTIIHSGYGAESDSDPDGFGAAQKDRIWSHQWSLTNKFTSWDNVEIQDYHANPGLWSTSGTAIGRVGVITHEMAHFLGLPDLYDYGDDGSGIGSFGLMANSWGFEGDQYHPPHPSAWSKVTLNWVTPKRPGEGVNPITAVQTNRDIYKIGDGEGGYPAGEYLLIENRQQLESDKNMPQAGLCIWHIDEKKAEPHDQGWPGQAGWPTNNKHYRIAMVQADGQYDLEQEKNNGDANDVFHGRGVTKLLPSNDPNIGANKHPNTDSYQNGNINPTGLKITEISNSGEYMTFRCEGAGCSGGLSPTPAPVPDCENGLELVEVFVRTDNYPAETTWKLTVDSQVAQTGGPYGADEKLTSFESKLCVSPNSCVKFEIADVEGDGMCCGWGQGMYEVSRAGVKIKSGGTFQNSEEFDVGTCGGGGPTTTAAPVPAPTAAPVTAAPVSSPTSNPTSAPTSKPIGNPTSAPTSKPTSAPTVGSNSNGCASNESMVRVQILTDNYGSETTWELKNGDSVLLQDGPFTDDTIQVHTKEMCVSESACLSMTISDSFGDGICCSEGSGSYKIFVDGVEQKSGGEFESSETTPIGNCQGPEPTTAPVTPPTAAPVTAAPVSSPTSNPTSAPTSKPIGNPTSAPTSKPTSAPTVGSNSNGCASNESMVRVQILTDNYGSETTWELKNGDSVLLEDGPFTDDTIQVHTKEMCVSESACLSMTISDSFGDGICCSEGSGSYKIFVDGVEQKSGGEFESSETTPIGNCQGPEPTTAPVTPPTASPVTPPTASPVTPPTASPVSSGGGNNSCPTGQTPVQITLKTDNFGDETLINLKQDGEDVYLNSVFENGIELIIDECVNNGACLEFIIEDSYGDGICCSEGQGSYTVTMGGAVVASGGEFDSVETSTFGQCGTRRGLRANGSRQKAKPARKEKKRATKPRNA